MTMNLFKISKAWFELSFEDHRITPTHTAFIFYILDLNNRLSWVDTFGLPALETGQVLNISYNTFRKILKELVEMKFVRLVKKSTNQYTANIISLDLLYQNLLKQKKSKYKASLKQGIKQSDIIKPIKPIKPIYISPDIFYKDQLLLSNGHYKEYSSFIDILFGTNHIETELTGVLSITNQVTAKQFEKLWVLKIQYKKSIAEILLKIENDPKYWKKKTSLYMTLLNWIKKDF